MSGSTMKEGFEAVRIFFTGVGGQGTLVATRLVGEAALEAGMPVTLSEIHGMAQRGGVVESTVVIGDIFSPTVADGEADILMAFEPVETLRALPKCHSGSLVISSTVPIVPFTVAVGQSAYPSHEVIYSLVMEKVAGVVQVDAVALAHQAGSDRAANVAMVGVLAGMNRLDISHDHWREALKRVLPAKLFDLNWRAFELGRKCGSGA
jgi:indolepyruvate ferredoxin oxidoreductase beta subunit